jgi:hypothetical protein
MVAMRSKVKEPSWHDISKFVESMGWFTERIDKSFLVLERDKQKIIARRFPDNNWKVEYYENSRLDDVCGITKAEFAKKEVVEMALMKTPFS